VTIMMRTFRVGLLCSVSASLAPAQQLSFPSAVIGNDTARAMSALADQTIAIYRDGNRDRHLDNHISTFRRASNT
jgi:hypothetical protein